MDVSSTNIDNLLTECHINVLPDEILEHILGFLRPYNDLRECIFVCKRWNKISLRVFNFKISNFNRCLINFNIVWEHYIPSEKSLAITKRYSHSACSYGNSMYVFGGCTCTSTTFNDLWRLDLSSRKWKRLLTMGTYPTPKALATLVHYSGLLVLFGGWTHPTPFPLHQALRTFNELHVYDIQENRWRCLLTPNLSPPPMAGHSATVHRHDMVVFGGICGMMELAGSANNIWCYNFAYNNWRRQETTYPKPVPRYNQSQIAIDDDHLLIIGGCGEKSSVLLNDVWLLTMRGTVWQWKEICVENPQWATSHPSNRQLWCHPACKSGTNVIAVGRIPNSTLPSFPLPKWNPMQRPQASDIFPRRISNEVVRRPVDRDVNVNGKRGCFTPRHVQSNAELPPQPQPVVVATSNNEGTATNGVRLEVTNSSIGHTSSNDVRPSASERIRNQYSYSSNRNVNVPVNMAAFRPASTNVGNKYRERQMEVLLRMEERLRNLSGSPMAQLPTENLVPSTFPPVKKPQKMAMFVMDITNVLTHFTVKWLPIKSVAAGGPDHTILYSLVAGQGEVIMFGGIQKDVSQFGIEESSLNVINTVTNTVHFISAPKSVI